MITTTPRLYGLLGHPVAHSLSPRMHTAAFRAAGLAGAYVAVDVAPGALEAVLTAARTLDFGGLNVTVPHKEQALALAVETDELAALVGACSTLVPTGNGWRAFNTDIHGLLAALESDLGFRPRGRRCLVLGAGGAARAAVVAFARNGAQEIVLANRNRGRAERLAEEMQQSGGPLPLRVAEVGRGLDGLEPGDLLVSATPLGLQPEGTWPWPASQLPRGLAVYDMAYRAAGETPLVLQARSAGCAAASGRMMLLHQGALAFTLWTGVPAPVAVMAKALGIDPGPGLSEAVRETD